VIARWLCPVAVELQRRHDTTSIDGAARGDVPDIVDDDVAAADLNGKAFVPEPLQVGVTTYQ